MKSESATYRAEWVVPIDQPPIKNGVVRVTNGLIQSVEQNPNVSTDETDLGQVILMPGLINAHTHLEFSDLAAPLGQPGMEFSDWIERVVQYRTGMRQQENPLEAKITGIANGLKESRDAGVALIGEISSQPVCPQAYQESEVDLVVFLEQLGRDDSKLQSQLASLDEDIREFRNCDIPIGISPHAPYSVSDRLFERLLKCAELEKLPMAMHLAESKAELSLIKDQSGPFVNLLKKLNAWFPESFSGKKEPIEYLHELANACAALVIHGNYLSDTDLEFIAARRKNVKPVFCPRTHQFFQHDRYPLPQMCDLGIAVAIGTDSKASSPDLCVLTEMKIAYRLFPEVSAEEVVRMGTINGAEALGRSHSFGSITPGKKAAFCVVKKVKTSRSDDPYTSILHGRPSIID